MRSLDGLDEAALAALVRRFYARVREDALLGPVFADAVQDWDEHLQRLTDFWTSLMLGSGRYRGNPAAAHLRHAARIPPALFARWLALWRQSSEESLAPAQAQAVQQRAERIALHLQRLIAGASSLLPPNEPSP